MNRRRTGPGLIALLVFLVGFLGIRLAVAWHQDIWADEIFSLAMATGHGLEHPAEAADPDSGDFVERPGAEPPSTYGRYLSHERPPAGPGRVIRAVLGSDTSPPLYYLGLSGWTRLLGTSDLAIRLFSIAWTLASLPVLAALARRLGGRAAVAPALLLFAFAPKSVYYATEARMYAMLLFLVMLNALLVLELRRRRPSWRWLGAWALASATGMLTHYFFVFPWLAFVAWLIVFPGRGGRGAILGASAVAVLGVSPWYAGVPESLGAWRVTQGWLDDPSPALARQFRSFLRLGWTYVSGGSGTRRENLLVLAAIAPLLGMIAWRGGRWFSAGRLLAFTWLAAALLGPFVFDRLRGTATMEVPRYALAGMPAAYLLLAAGLSRLARRTRWILLTLLLASWVPGLAGMVRSETREAGEPFGRLGRELAERAGPDDLIIVHSIPSGVTGIARAIMDVSGAEGKGIALASWVGQLGLRRMPEDMEALSAGRRRIFLVIIHHVGEPPVQETWLREHGRLVRQDERGDAMVFEFAPPDPDATFGPRP